MTTKLIYVVLPNAMVRIFQKVREAQTPERFTGDFLATKLGFRGGNNRQFIPLAKKLGFLGSDGRPTDVYTQFRSTNKATSGAAMARALKTGYKELFARNEYANTLSKEDLKALVIEITGLEPKNRIVKLVCATFESLKGLADFEASGKPANQDGQSDRDHERGKALMDAALRDDLDLNLSYSFNLVLPKTDDPAVFSAIFLALRETLLRK